VLQVVEEEMVDYTHQILQEQQELQTQVVEVEEVVVTQAHKLV
jgi:hypothetical protein